MGLATSHISSFSRSPESISVYSSVLETTSSKSATVFQWQRLAGDSIGTFALTLQNVIVGSAIRIETFSGALVEFRTSTVANEQFFVPAYVIGNANNSLRIKIRKGSSSPFYQPFETQTTAFVGSQSIFVSQIPDE